MKLKASHQKFVDEYIIDLNASAAAARAGYSAKTSKQIGEQLLKREDIQQALQKAIAKRSKRTEITADMVIQELAKIAFFNPKDMFREDGSPKNISELDDHVAAAVSGIEIIENHRDEERISSVKKYRLCDKKGALDSLGKHLGMFKERVVVANEEGETFKVEDVSDKDLARRIAFLLTKGMQKQ